MGRPKRVLSRVAILVLVTLLGAHITLLYYFLRSHPQKDNFLYITLISRRILVLCVFFFFFFGGGGGVGGGVGGVLKQKVGSTAKRGYNPDLKKRLNVPPHPPPPPPPPKP